MNKQGQPKEEDDAPNLKSNGELEQTPLPEIPEEEDPTDIGTPEKKSGDTSIPDWFIRQSITPH